MVDEFKSIRESLFKTLTGLSISTRDLTAEDEGEDEDEGPASRGLGSTPDAKAARALIGALFAKAGRSKDEIVQVIGREIGLTIAALLKEPLAQIAKNQKLQISFELVPKDRAPKEGATGRPEEASRPFRRRRTKQSSRRSKVGKSGA